MWKNHKKEESKDNKKEIKIEKKTKKKAALERMTRAERLKVRIMKREIKEYTQEVKVNGRRLKSEERHQEIQDKKDIKFINKENRRPKGTRSLKNIQGNIIDLSYIKKVYTTKTLKFIALQSTSLSIKKGDFVVILGPSGSGKTTLLNILSGLDRPTSGDVVVADRNLSAMTDLELTKFRRDHVGFVFQSYNLLPSLNVSDNVDVGRALQKNPHKRKDIIDLLDQLDMGPQSKKRTYELSGGQQQRVSIARALAKQPDILIGDEPTGALDTHTSLKVFQLFQEINEKNKTTVIVVTHNPNVAQLANKVIYVKDGKVQKVTEQKPINATTLKEI
ncbi:ABC transporter ATP-binding protein [Mycoplasma marinum]|uniref:ABC transporter ATP-binding protein n=1 Tax=Mycoplasma marinum TaxID=1937190 RepID=A0A4R0XJQ5_9MOLU|nr:ABC transporter ATP-binding protein [Mycoplasma marinum]TCG10876.1 ABC transporter ATP-binding protein [Mycoplasma marinum]